MTFMYLQLESHDTCGKAHESFFGGRGGSKYFCVRFEMKLDLICPDVHKVEEIQLSFLSSVQNVQLLKTCADFSPAADTVPCSTPLVGSCLSTPSLSPTLFH